MFKEIYIDLDGVLADFFLNGKISQEKNWWELDNNLLAIQKLEMKKIFGLSSTIK